MPGRRSPKMKIRIPNGSVVTAAPVRALNKITNNYS
jgi:hypothetical protein